MSRRSSCLPLSPNPTAPRGGECRCARRESKKWLFPATWKFSNLRASARPIRSRALPRGSRTSLSSWLTDKSCRSLSSIFRGLARSICTPRFCLAIAVRHPSMPRFYPATAPPELPPCGWMPVSIPVTFCSRARSKSPPRRRRVPCTTVWRNSLRLCLANRSL